MALRPISIWAITSVSLIACFHGTTILPAARFTNRSSIEERRGDYLGKTVQVIPHVTDEIKARIRELSDESNTMS